MSSNKASENLRKYSESQQRSYGTDGRDNKYTPQSLNGSEYKGKGTDKYGAVGDKRK